MWIICDRLRQLRLEECRIEREEEDSGGGGVGGTGTTAVAAAAAGQEKVGERTKKGKN